MANDHGSMVRRVEKRFDQGLEAVAGAFDRAAVDTRQTRYMRYLWQRTRQDQLAQVAGSLTFTTLLSLVPFVTIALGLFAAFPIFDEIKDALEEFMLDNLLPEEASSAVVGHIGEFSNKAAGLTAAGVAALGVTAIMLLQTIDRAFNAIWRVPRPRPLAQRILVYWAAVSLGPILIGGGLVITSYLVSASVGLLPGGEWITVPVLALLPMFLTMVAFTLLYVAVPNRDVQWKHAAIGGAAATLGFELMKGLFGYYIAKFPTYHLIYGTFAAIPIFLLWIYLSWTVTLIGGLIAATWPLLGYERAETRRTPGAGFADALRILALLHAQREHGGVPPRQIRAALRTGFSDSETLLERMAAAGWIGRVHDSAGKVRWALLCDAQQLRISEVFRRFAFDAQAAARRLDAGDAVLAASVARAAALIDDGLDMSLAQAFETPAAASGPRMVETA
ncbi:MAG: YihY family inner membrane protein [Burkholderiales bacterium]